MLSFVAPVLDDATRVEGRVSMRLAEAWFPLIASPKSEAKVEGDVLFDQVRFMPGPFADELLSVFQRERKPLAVLRDPIAVKIAGRKIYQQGLSIPVANLASIGFDGSVDFDRNLDLVAHFGLVPPQNGVPVLSPIMRSRPVRPADRRHARSSQDQRRSAQRALEGDRRGLAGKFARVRRRALDRLLRGLPGPPLGGLIPPLGRRGAGAPAPPPPRPDPAVPRAGQDSDDDPADTRHDVRKPPAPSMRPQASPKTALTPLERRKLREKRKQERLEKKAARRKQQDED